MIIHCHLQAVSTDTDALLTFKELFHGGIPCFSEVLPVLSMDDEALIAAWGCPGLQRSKSSTREVAWSLTKDLGYLNSWFDVRYDLPTKWLEVVAKKFPTLAITIGYASVPLMLCGTRTYRGNGVYISENQGNPEAVEAYILSYFPEETGDG